MKPRPAHQPELFDTRDAFALVSTDGIDGHAALAAELARRDAIRDQIAAQGTLPLGDEKNGPRGPA